jgi:putative heme-binding domain-containing protein
LDWFIDASNTGGGMSCFGYLKSARQRFIERFNSEDRATLQSIISKPLSQATAQLESARRPIVREWTFEELVKLADNDNGERSLEQGRAMFTAASCFQCHRVGGSGSMVGPDLTGVSGRFSMRDILQAIVEPSQQISDQYQQTVFSSNGRVLVGRVTNLNGETIHVSTNMLDPKTTEVLNVDDIDEQYPSDVSVMPNGLLNTLNKEEVLDLLAFLRSGGDAHSAVYQRPST